MTQQNAAGLSAQQSAQQAEMQQLFEKNSVSLPEVSQVVEGTVISAANNEVHIDINGIATGVVRGPELNDESGVYTNLRPGDTVTATVLEIENELGELELSFREAGHKKAWDELQKMFNDQVIVQATITDANKGGILARVGNVTGFLPVSQLTVEHYPRVEGANKSKILERLQTYIGQVFTVRIIDVDEVEGKLIVSEKAAKEDEQSALLAGFTVGSTVEGVVTGVVDFGAFVEFGEGLEGLVHISELAWQRIDDPKDIIKVGDKVKAQIIAIDGGKISLSMRRLQEDPWKIVAKKYNVGDVVEGKVLKLNPFGAFVELDPEIHGLAHISELSWKKIQSPQDVLKSGEMAKFKIVSIEPDDHRLGLSLKQLQPRPGTPKPEVAEAHDVPKVPEVDGVKDEAVEKAADTETAAEEKTQTAAPAAVPAEAPVASETLAETESTTTEIPAETAQ